MKRYVEIDVIFLGLKVLNVDFPIIDEPNSVLTRNSKPSFQEL